MHTLVGPEHMDLATKLGVLRWYMTRHGAGPLPTEDPDFVRQLCRDDHNVYTPWQRQLRAGAFDMPLVRYALHAVRKIADLDGIVLTHMDKIGTVGKVPICINYRGPEPRYAGRDLTRQEAMGKALQAAEPVWHYVQPESFVSGLEANLETRFAILSRGPTADDKLELAPT